MKPMIETPATKDGVRYQRRRKVRRCTMIVASATVSRRDRHQSYRTRGSSSAWTTSVMR